MASRRSRAPRCSSSYPSRGPPSRDTAHRRARSAPGIGVGRLHGPGHASDGARGACMYRAGDGDRRRGRRRRPHRFHARGLHRLLVRRRDRGEAVAEPAGGARAHGHLGRTPRSGRAGARGPSARGADRAARRHAGSGRSPGRGGGAARGAGGTAARGALPRRDPHADVKRRLGFSTRAVHGDPEARPDWAPVVAPLYQSATFTNPIGSSQEVIYARYGNNPNHVAIAKRLALLEGAEAALFVGSGMGAIALSHLAVLRPGDHLLSSEWVYGGVYRLFAQEFGRFGIEVSFVNPLEPRTWKRGLKKNTRAIFVETPTNPLLRVLDVEPIATLCKTEGLALLVDATFATPLNYRPLEHGADVVIHSATKYLNGHADVLAGAVAGSESVIEGVRAGGGAVSARAHDPDPRAQSRRGRDARVRAAAHVARDAHARRPGAGWHSRWLPEIFHRTGGRRRHHRGLRASSGAAVSDQVHECLQSLPQGGARPEGRVVPHREGRVRVPHRPFGRRQIHRPEAGLRR